jgi:hypothetical protein
VTCRNFCTAAPAARTGDDPLQLVARLRLGIESDLVSFEAEVRVVHHVAEGIAQARRAVGGNARRRHDRKTDIGDVTEQLQHGAVEVVTGKFGDRRHVGQLPAAPRGDGIKEVDLAGFDPVPSCQDIA